ncbi:MAG: hypothetical protein WDN72_06125 [Alphaproteobacteria bacterium]
MQWKDLPSDAPPAVAAFVKTAESGAVGREALTEEAERLTGLRMLDDGSLNNEEIGLMLRTLVAWKLTQGHSDNMPRPMPDEIGYVVLGHGYGAEEHWRLERGGDVQAFVNKRVPRGERVWVMACETTNSRNIAALEGKELVSQGLSAEVKPRPTGWKKA